MISDQIEGVPSLRNESFNQVEGAPNQEKRNIGEVNQVQYQGRKWSKGLLVLATVAAVVASIPPFREVGSVATRTIGTFSAGALAVGKRELDILNLAKCALMATGTVLLFLNPQVAVAILIGTIALNIMESIKAAKANKEPISAYHIFSMVTDALMLTGSVTGLWPFITAASLISSINLLILSDYSFKKGDTLSGSCYMILAGLGFANAIMTLKITQGGYTTNGNVKSTSYTYNPPKEGSKPHFRNPSDRNDLIIPEKVVFYNGRGEVVAQGSTQSQIKFTVTPEQGAIKPVWYDHNGQEVFSGYPADRFIGETSVIRNRNLLNPFDDRPINPFNPTEATTVVTNKPQYFQNHEYERVFIPEEVVKNPIAQEDFLKIPVGSDNFAFDLN